MTRACVAPIVEGYGEVESVRTLIERIWHEIVGGEYVEVLKPIRCKRQQVVKPEHLTRAAGLAAMKLGQSLSPAQTRFVLLLVDADEDPPCRLGPELLQKAREARPGVDIACVAANVEYETWFFAAAESLGAYLQLSSGEVIPSDPECRRAGKAWVEKRWRGVKYSPTQDQPRMTAQMDLGLCRRRCPSFDKLCRELESRYAPRPHAH